MTHAGERQADTRTRNTESEALRREVESLRAAVEGQARFMSFLSHDLRGNLNGMVLMLEVIRRELAGRPEFEETLVDIEMVREAIGQTVGMMEKYLFADQLRRGRIEPKREPVHLREIIAAAAKKAGGAEGAVEVNVAEDAVVETDRELLSRAVGHLMANAVKFGKGRKRVRATVGDEHWSIEVADEGPEISEDRLKRLLDPERRPEANDKGVGLATAGLVARLLGGRLEGESTAGRGTVFRIVCPADG